MTPAEQAAQEAEVAAEVASWEQGRAEWPESWAEAWDQVQALWTGIPADAEEVVTAWLDMMGATDEGLLAIEATVEQLPPEIAAPFWSRLSTNRQEFNDIGAGVYSTLKTAAGNPAVVIVGGITIASAAVAWIYYTFDSAERLAAEVEADRVRADAELLRAQTEADELAARVELNQQGLTLQDTTLREIPTTTPADNQDKPEGYDFGWVEGAVSLLVVGLLGIGAYQALSTRGR